MSAAIKLKPCPFCEGPPVPIVQREFGGRGGAPILDEYEDNSGLDLLGLAVRAFVFCHECGSEGPAHDAILEVRADYFAAEAEGVRLWQERGKAGRECYDAGEADGLNLYPRAGEEPNG